MNEEAQPDTTDAAAELAADVAPAEEEEDVQLETAEPVDDAARPEPEAATAELETDDTATHLDATEPEQTAETIEAIDVQTLERMTSDFGADLAVAVLLNGGTYEDARTLHYEQLEAENEALRAKVAAPGEPSAAQYTDAEPDDAVPDRQRAQMKGKDSAAAKMADSIRAERAKPKR